MLRINILIVTILMVPSSLSLYNEKYRPQLHFSPETNWINDPNGLVYHNGSYHLFYQYNPNDIVAGNIHWGHAISPDLVHWEHLPIALYPKDGNLMYSGSAIIDTNNVTGLRVNENTDTLIAVFTAHDEKTSEQKQWLAYSNDGPEFKNFKFYKNNPIIPNPNSDVQEHFRDPAVIKYKDHYVIVLAAGDRILIYNSNDLLNWQLVSEFLENVHGRVRECPSLFPLNITINGVEVEKWVLTMSLWDFTTDSGEILANQQYYLGSFDGKTFTSDYSEDTELWLDDGPDSYAGITFNQVPNGRITFISWMNRWVYAPKFNFNVWNGQMGVAREFKLKHARDQIRLASLPVHELKKLRTKSLVKRRNVSIKNYYVYEIAKNCNETEHLLDIEMTLDLTNLKDSFDIMFSGENDYLKISLKGNEFTLDRSHAGKTDFPSFANEWKGQRLSDSSKMKLKIIIDRSSIEFFADDGLTVLTALFYSDENIASKMHIFAHNSSIILKDLKIYKMKSIWDQY